MDGTAPCSGDRCDGEGAGQGLRRSSKREGRVQRPCLQVGDCRRGVVGVEGAQDKVACQRCLDGNFRSFRVADLPDHDDVGVLTQDVAQARRRK